MVVVGRRIDVGYRERVVRERGEEGKCSAGGEDVEGNIVDEVRGFGVVVIGVVGVVGGWVSR